MSECVPNMSIVSDSTSICLETGTFYKLSDFYNNDNNFLYISI